MICPKSVRAETEYQIFTFFPLFDAPLQPPLFPPFPSLSAFHLLSSRHWLWQSSPFWQEFLFWEMLMMGTEGLAKSCTSTKLPSLQVCKFCCLDTNNSPQTLSPLIPSVPPQEHQVQSAPQHQSSFTSPPPVLQSWIQPLWAHAGQLKGQTPANVGDLLPNNHTWLPCPLPPEPPGSFWQLGHQQRAQGWAEFSSWLL